MQVIPVIDVRGGVAVAASRGDRARYRPLETPLAASADPLSVAEGLRALYPFATLYVADLDGIEGRGAGFAMQQRLAEAWPGSEIWIDDGSIGAGGDGSPPTPTLPTRGRGPVAHDGNDIGPLALSQGGKAHRSRSGVVNHIIGSESLSSLEDYHRARMAAGPTAPLSLDFRGDDFMGPPGLLDDAALWPERLIVMTLARVGSGEGPDMTRLASILARAEGRQVYAAGGVRSMGDLRELRDVGVAGALVATALHAGGITRDDLEALARGDRRA